MTIQVFKMYTANAYEGQQAFGSEPHVVVSGISESDKISFGKAVQMGVGADGILLGSKANVFGFALREINMEATNRPSDGETDYVKGFSVSVFRQGTINVLVTKAAAVKGVAANVNTASGSIEGGAVASGAVATKNVMFLESGAVGDIVKARIDIVL